MDAGTTNTNDDLVVNFSVFKCVMIFKDDSLLATAKNLRDKNYFYYN